jgi:hypothetical protein
MLRIMKVGVAASSSVDDRLFLQYALFFSFISCEVMQ